LEQPVALGPRHIKGGSQDLEILLDFGRFGTAMQEQRANKSWHLHTLRYQ
jgi:hypothetical protein